MNVPNMTLRDWFAGQALKALMTGDSALEKDAPYYAEAAYKFANAMMAEREKTLNVHNDSTLLQE